ncbi:MAG: extracellular solute-binding protein [Anaerolineales bacterium]|nr:extracellular solute-binding protein [Anaerolineales bacterium]
MSCIPDAEVDSRTLAALAAEFEQQNQVKVHLQPMTWGTVWSELIQIASHGRGPDISHIGGSWVSSLAIMNVLRPFRRDEIEAMGSAQAFLKPTWDSVRLVDDERIWSIPWTGYVYLVCYRKSLLQQAGLDEATAFGSQAALSETVLRLRQSQVEIPWLVPYIPPPHTDLLHMAASFVWSAGGELVDPLGARVAFDQPPAMAGMETWLDILRSTPPAFAQLDRASCYDLFTRGRSAILLIDNRYAATNFVNGDLDPAVRSDIGFAVLTETPWFGGGNFIVWKHAQGYPERERAAVEFIRFLAGKRAQVRWAKQVHSMPANRQALDEILSKGHPMQKALHQAADHGRSFRNIPLWRRLEHQISLELGAILRRAQENRNVSSASLLQDHLVPLAERLNLTLRG